MIQITHFCKDMEETELFAFYGSLRRGMDNYNKYKSVLEFITCTRIPGFTLYSLSAYPYAVKSEDRLETIVIEIFRIKGKEGRDKIHQLEVGAGYILEFIEVNDQSVGIYLFERAGNNPKVKSGDWVSFYGKQVH